MTSQCHLAMSGQKGALEVTAATPGLPHPGSLPRGGSSWSGSTMTLILKTVFQDLLSSCEQALG